jgi:hypothetical protein
MKLLGNYQHGKNQKSSLVYVFALGVFSRWDKLLSKDNAYQFSSYQTPTNHNINLLLYIT